MSNLPTLVFGISSMKANSSGSHHFATRPREVLAQLLGAERSAPSRSDDAGQRALGPALVGLGDHRRLGHVRVRHQRVLELDRGDPLAAGLDDVLGAVGDPDEARWRRSSRRRRCAASRRGTSRRRPGPRSRRARSTGRGPRARPSTRRPTAARRRRRRRSRASTSGDEPAGRARGSASAPRPRRRPAGAATAPSGLVSVMPQAWTIRTPWRSSKRASAARARPSRRRPRARRLERSGSCSSA